MSSMLPVAVYGLKVPGGDVMVAAAVDFPATFHITMAAIDPSATPEHTGTANGNAPARSTLKIIYEPMSPEDDEDEERKTLHGLLEDISDDDDEEDDDEDEEDEESSDDEEEKNGGPSDPSKTKKARKEAAAAALMKSLSNGVDESDDEMEDASRPKVNGVTLKSNKGKGKAVAGVEESSDEEDDEDIEDEEVRELVVCTLDPNQHYQQPLNITIPEDQNAYFKVSGTHAVYLTGNYVIAPDNGHDHDGNGDLADYDMSPDEDELEGEYDDESASDDLDDLEDPRITEVESEDEAPKLIKNGKPETAPKGKNKRAAEDSDEEPATLDAIMDKSLKPAEVAQADQPKLSKKQLKKLKNNAGKAVEAAVENKGVKKEDDSTPAKGDKKVQFAKNLEQGPTGTPKDAKSPKEVKQESKVDAKSSKHEKEKPKATLGPKVLQDGLKIDDRKLGSGPAAKRGDKLGLRYIGKLENGKVFDANKGGASFKFTLGHGEVIKGWDTGIAGMSVGGERRINIPAKLAYGSKGQPGIPANSPLQFDVKLLSIN